MNKQPDHVYLCVDFEACDDTTWIAYAAGVFAYPTGEVYESIMRVIDRPLEKFDESRKKFWTVDHVRAYHYLKTHAVAESSEVELELDICRFIQKCHLRFPNLTVISDNPAFDLRLLDNILSRHGFPSCTMRSNGSWHHPLCTISYQIGHEKNTRKRRTMWSRTDREEPEDIPHTPWADVKRIVTAFFRVLDAQEFSQRY